MPRGVYVNRYQPRYQSRYQPIKLLPLSRELPPPQISMCHRDLRGMSPSLEFADVNGTSDRVVTNTSRPALLSYEVWWADLQRHRQMVL